ncbi:unnamed protein product [Heligmosomoides polygyrus]|uniref:Uncharacterized protein n=1 Tax=Heligmosomoides polygyrus TaxID=6339 RepID=A0A183FEA7_HELPZ|nr:unnamed protein product [Heligmosomoides polygyrus]
MLDLLFCLHGNGHMLLQEKFLPVSVSLLPTSFRQHSDLHELPRQRTDFQRDTVASVAAVCPPDALLLSPETIRRPSAPRYPPGRRAAAAFPEIPAV